MHTSPLHSVLVRSPLLPLLSGLSLGGGQQLALELANSSSGPAYARVADNPRLEPQTLTVEACIQPTGSGTGFASDNFGAVIVGKCREGAAGPFLSSYHLGWSSGTRRVVALVGHNLGSSGSFVMSQSTVELGETAHVAMTFDGSFVRVYVNGALEGEAAAGSATIDYANENLLFGAANFGGGYDRRFDGHIDEVRIWGAARSEAEIAGNRSCRLVGDEPQLVGYWPFDDGTLTDRSGGGHLGVLVGSGGSLVAAPKSFPTYCTLIGTPYCTPAVANSTGLSGETQASGSLIATNNQVVLSACDLPMNSFGYFLTGTTQAFISTPGGSQGNLCLGGPLGRYTGPGEVQYTGNGSTAHLSLDLPTTPTPTGPAPVLSGEQRTYQYWYRDTVGGAGTSNFASALTVTYD